MRPSVPQDLPLLLNIHASTRAEAFALLPLDEAQKAALIDMQARAQHEDYLRRCPDAERWVISLGAEPVGRLYLDRRARTHHILDIAFLPQARGRGFGTAIIADLVDEAAAAGKGVSLQVERSNPAQRLYTRLGFVTVEDQGVYRLMGLRIDP